MAQDIFIGIDGGATKSRVRIEDAQGKLLGQAVGGPSNIRLSVDGAWKVLTQTIEEALKEASISLQDPNYHFHAGMGLAGCEVAEAYDAFTAHAHPFKTLQVSSDAHVACVGAHQGEDGAIIIIGTGVVGYQIKEGENTRVGGWGFPHDDEGGGAWLGLQAARLTLQWLDHRVEKAALLEDVYDFFERDFEKFVTWANRANSSEFARLAPIVINHAQQNEATAIRLLRKGAHAVDRIGTTLEKIRRAHDLFPLALFGGIAPFMEPFLTENLRRHLVPRKADANSGAMIMIRQQVAKGA